MIAMVKSNLSEFWIAKEKEWGRSISVYEVSKATGIPWDTIDNLRRDKTSRFDSHVLARICKFFNVSEGALVPFLTVSYLDAGNGKAA